MDKIKILLIDDNPAGSLLSGDDYIPKISFKGTSAEGLEEYFQMEYLQSLTDIKEYRFFYKKVSNTHGDSSMDKMAFTPDAVLFDYNFKVADELENQEAIEQLLNCKVAANLKYNTYRKKTNPELSDSPIAPWQKEVNDNAFGCFAGAILVSDFVNNACVGLPTTSYEDGGFHGKEEIEYFEDLLTADFGDAFSKKGRKDPTWFDLLTTITFLKRNRILSMASEFRLSFNLQNLLNLMNEKHAIPNEKGERAESGFTIRTQYGNRTFYLDALFVDILPELRDKAISDFAEQCFNTFKNASTYTPSNDEIITSMRNANYLFDAYQSKAFWERLLFSKLYFIEENYRNANEKQEKGVKPAKKGNAKNDVTPENRQLKLSVEEEKILNTFILNKNSEIKVKSTKKGFEVTNAKELRTIEDRENINVRRLSALFAILRLYMARQEYLKAEGKVNAWNTKYGEQYPGLIECLHLIFPIPANPEILPIHSREVSAAWSPYIDSLDRFGKLSDIKKGREADMYLFHPDVNGSFFDKGTKSILIAYSNFINLEFDYLPKWLK